MYNYIMLEYDKTKNIREFLHAMIALEGTSMCKILRKIKEIKNVTLSPEVISRKLKTGTIRFNEVEEIANYLDYEIIIRKKKKP